jgi:hypothetical protein
MIPKYFINNPQTKATLVAKELQVNALIEIECTATGEKLPK